MDKWKRRACRKKQPPYPASSKKCSIEIFEPNDSHEWVPIYSLLIHSHNPNHHHLLLPAHIKMWFFYNINSLSLIGYRS